VSLYVYPTSNSFLFIYVYLRVFSPSANQRFISRFLVSIWMSGEDEGKQLLTRMLPSGLVDYLQFGALSDEQSANLDKFEEEHYAAYNTGETELGMIFSPLKSRLRDRIITATAHSEGSQPAQGMVDEADALFHNCNIESSSPADLAGIENFRIMFHAMTQVHSLPDLIWNEQTRLELREALELELAILEKEQRRQVGRRVAWNYAQFYVHYDSLNGEPKVGPVYVHPFLEAGATFITSLPNQKVLFEKFLRRVLVNLEKDTNLAVVCAKCLCKLYNACRQSMEGFDDMLLLVRMMDQASNLELQHHLLDLIDMMSHEATNLLQLLDKEFINIFLKFASLAHLNMDQIGNLLARMTKATLLLKDAQGLQPSSIDSPLSPSINPAMIEKRKELESQKRLSSWIPEDDSCPRIWYVSAPVKKLPPISSSLQGPYRVTELRAYVESRIVGPDWLVAPSSAEDYFESQLDTVIDTGLWKRPCEYFQVQVNSIPCLFL
jgi:hypothetical protein